MLHDDTALRVFVSHKTKMSQEHIWVEGARSFRCSLTPSPTTLDSFTNGSKSHFNGSVILVF